MDECKLKKYNTRAKQYANYTKIPFVIYHGEKKYCLPNPKNENFILTTEEPLNSFSKLENGFYLTPVNVNDVDEYGKDVLYCKYMGNLYSIMYYTEGFRSIRIYSKEPNKELGFIYVPHDNYYYKDITIHETDGIYSEEKYLLHELKEYMPEIFNQSEKS